MSRFENSPLHQIMHPRSVAFWGASGNPTGMGSIQLSQLLALGFQGPVYPIHPKEPEILGLKAYASVQDVPGPVDLAVLVLPTGVVPRVLEECGRAGVKRAVIVSAGFGEMGSAGMTLQKQIVDIAKAYGIWFLGPNCIGVVNSPYSLNTTFYPYQGKAGFVGMASQSGSFITQMFPYLESIGLGFNQGISVGNEAMLDIVDCLEYLGECPDTKVIALYIEAIRRGREFVRVAREVSKKKPVVAYYVGGSKAGRKASLSHTGALAGPDLLYDGVFSQCGVVRAYSIEEMFDFCWVLGTQPLPTGRKVAILTHSGGPGAAASDSADRCHLELADFSAESQSALQAVVPATASITNPVDLTFARNFGDYLERIPGILLSDENVDSLFMYCLLPHRRVVTSVASQVSPENAAELADAYIKSQALAAASHSKRHGKPVVGGTFCNRNESFVCDLQDNGFPLLPSPERAIKALAALTRYASARAVLMEE